FRQTQGALALRRGGCRLRQAGAIHPPYPPQLWRRVGDPLYHGGDPSLRLAPRGPRGGEEAERLIRPRRRGGSLGVKRNRPSKRSTARKRPSTSRLGIVEVTSCMAACMC